MKQNSVNQQKTNQKTKPLRYCIFMALLSGALLFLSFPVFGLSFAAWFALVPLFAALRGTDRAFDNLNALECGRVDKGAHRPR